MTSISILKVYVTQLNIKQFKWMTSSYCVFCKVHTIFVSEFVDYEHSIRMCLNYIFSGTLEQC